MLKQKLIKNKICSLILIDDFNNAIFDAYSLRFEDLIDFVHSAAPGNYFNEVLLREEVKMFPKQALRELIANALTHALCIA